MLRLTSHTLTVRMNSQTETYVVEPFRLQYTQIHRVSHFNLVGIVLTAFRLYFRHILMNFRFKLFFKENLEMLFYENYNEL